MPLFVQLQCQYFFSWTVTFSGCCRLGWVSRYQSSWACIMPYVLSVRRIWIWSWRTQRKSLHLPMSTWAAYWCSAHLPSSQVSTTPRRSEELSLRGKYGDDIVYQCSAGNKRLLSGCRLLSRRQNVTVLWPWRMKLRGERLLVLCANNLFQNHCI